MTSTLTQAGMKKHEGLGRQGISRALGLSGCPPVPVYCGCDRDTENATGDEAFPPGFRTKWHPVAAPPNWGGGGCKMLVYRSSLNITCEMWGSPSCLTSASCLFLTPLHRISAVLRLWLFAQAILQDPESSTDHSLKMASTPQHSPCSPDSGFLSETGSS